MVMLRNANDSWGLKSVQKCDNPGRFTWTCCEMLTIFEGQNQVKSAIIWWFLHGPSRNFGHRTFGSRIWVKSAITWRFLHGPLRKFGHPTFGSRICVKSAIIWWFLHGPLRKFGRRTFGSRIWVKSAIIALFSCATENRPKVRRSPPR